MKNLKKSVRLILRKYPYFVKRSKQLLNYVFQKLDNLDSKLEPSENAVSLPPILGNNPDDKCYSWPWNYIPEKFPDSLPSGQPWPKISIVTPSYNYGNYIEATIRSVILQGYPNLEYIVVDGDSTDNTKQILERYGAELSICISEPDEGQTDALNKGFRQATGDILAWLNSDDQYLPDTLKQVAIAFDMYRCDLLVGGCILDQDHHRWIHRCKFPMGELSPLPYRSMLDFGGDWLSGKFFMQPEVFLSRHAWEISGGILNENLNFGMDYDLWLRMARKNVVFCHIPQNLAIFRIHNKQKTIFSGDIKNYPEYIAISRYYQALDGIEVLDRDCQIVDFPKHDGSGTEPVDIKATLPLDEFIDRPLVQYTTAYGKYYLPFDGTLGVVTRKIRSGKLESPEVVEIAQKYIRSGSTVIEVGTRFGQTTSLLAKMVGDHGQVLAFESDEYLFYALQKSLVANQLFNVRSYLRQVGNSNICALDSVNKDQNSSTTQVIRIDDLGITNPITFFKISSDVNGTDIIQGAIQIILRDKPIILLQNQVSESLNHIVGVIHYNIEPIFNSDWLVLKPDSARSEFVLLSDTTKICALEKKLMVTNLCKFLKFRSEVDECTKFLHQNGYTSHNLVCKDWDIAHIVSEVGDGNFLDMGSSDSYILKNLTLKNIKGDLYGIDLNEPDVIIPRVQYLKGDLMKTGLPSQHFANISCLSVIEHEVNFDRFASEVSRLLQPGGRLFVTFDYWEPKVSPPIRLYGLAWQPLDRQKVCEFIAVCYLHKLKLVNKMDWELGEPVIHYGYYAPHPKVEYTFGMAVFEKIMI